MVGDVAHTVKGSTFDIFQCNCFVDGLTQEDDALVGYEEVAKFVEHGSFFFNGGVFNVRTFKGNSFINAEFTGKFKVVVFLFNNFAFTEATVCVSVASFVFFHRQVKFQSGYFVVFCVPNATIFFQCTFNVRFEFVGDVQGFAVCNQTVFNFHGEASGFRDAVENFVEVVIKSLAAHCKAIFIIVVEYFV